MRTFFILACILFQSINYSAQKSIDLYQDASSYASAVRVPENLKGTKSIEVLQVIPSPTKSTCSLTFDGEHLWVGSFPNMIYKIDRLNGELIKSLPVNIFRPYGLEFINGKLWVIDRETNQIHQIDTINGAIIKSFGPFPNFESAIAWDGHKLWRGNANPVCITQIDTASGVCGLPIPINISFPTSFTFQRNFLWISDNMTSTIYKIDTVSNNKIDSFPSPKTTPNGVAWDGDFLWIAFNDNTDVVDSIYKIDLNYNPETILTFDQNPTFLIYPNPSKGIINLSFNKRLVLPIQVKVFNIGGNTVYNSFFYNYYANFQVEAEPGVLYILVSDINTIEIGKVVIDK